MIKENPSHAAFTWSKETKNVGKLLLEDKMNLLEEL
jgi:hypothetical protein